MAPSSPLPRLLTTGARRPASLPQDAYGLALTTTPEAARAYDKAVDRLLTVELGTEDALRRALDVDPDFALGHAVMATVLADRGAPTVEVRTHLHRARRCSHRATEREASFVTSAVLWCSPGLSGDAALVRHVRRWPRDRYAISLLTPSIASAGVADGAVDVWPLLDDFALGDDRDWWLTSIRAFARTEAHRWVEAEDLALAALGAQPRSGHAAHAFAHVLYETGRHAEAVRWIDEWRAGAGRDQRFGGHFSWHAGLAQLALGDVDAVRARYDRELGGLRGTRALVDAGSLLVRCVAHGMSLGTRRAQAVIEHATGCVPAPATPFLGWHLALLAGACADGDLLVSCEDHARAGSGDDRRPRPERDAWSQVVSVCRAVRAGREGRHATAAALLASLGDTTAMGGSPAQRELIDDVTLRELLAVGETEAAGRIASGRLRRRPTVFDERVCALVGDRWCWR